jgi:amidohydrolase
MRKDIQQAVKELSDQIIAWRRDFHRHPEIAYQEERTSRVIREILEKDGYEVQSFARTGLRGVLSGKGPGPCVALRADMDALPITEEGDKEYISQHPGAAHSCAHDGHMAIALGVARILAGRRSEWNGRVAFLFQPSEEHLPGGAKPMIDEGALDGVDAVFGLHLWQSLPTGQVGMVKGPMMAQPDTFDLVIKGRGGHGSMPQQTVDPIVTAAQLIINCQSIVSRNCDPLKPLVVSFGKIAGGDIYNVIPDQVKLMGTVRTFDAAIQEMAERRVREIVADTCRTFGATAELEYHRGYPPVVNDPAMIDFAVETLENTLGPERVAWIDPVMGGEDFAYFLQERPGAFMFFGMGDGMEYPHHHPAFDIDERSLPEATLFSASLLLDFLEKQPLK